MNDRAAIRTTVSNMSAEIFEFRYVQEFTFFFSEPPPAVKVRVSRENDKSFTRAVLGRLGRP